LEIAILPYPLMMIALPPKVRLRRSFFYFYTEKFFENFSVYTTKAF